MYARILGYFLWYFKLGPDATVLITNNKPEKQTHGYQDQILNGVHLVSTSIKSCYN